MRSNKEIIEVVKASIDGLKNIKYAERFSL